MRRIQKEAVPVPNYQERFIWLDLDKGRFHSRLELGVESILKKMDSKNNKPITFYISGLGGDFYAFLKLHHFIISMRSPVIFAPFKRVKSGCFYITQSGRSCVSLPGARFEFHHAVDQYLTEDTKRVIMSQLDYAIRIDKLKLVDAVQILLFTQRGRPISKIADLFAREARIGVTMARQLGLVDGIFDCQQFQHDKKFVENYLKKRLKPL